MAEDLTLRTCGRTGCRWPAAASLSFRYGTGQVWLLDLSPEPDPSLYDLCPHHADALTVPKGWERVDQRVSRAAVSEPAGRDLDPTDGGAPPGAGGYGGNRYASLTAALPRLARAYQSTQEQGVEPASTPPAGGRVVERSRQLPVPSRDLSPVPVEQALAIEGPPDPAAGEADPLVVEGLDVFEEHGDGVVVPIEAGSRRRG